MQGATGRICWPSSRPTNDRYSAREIHGASEVRPDSRGPRVAPAQHCAAFASDQKAVPEFSPRWEAHSASLIGSWEDLHGRNLTSALMRSRVHNRTGDRGGEPFRLTEGGLPSVLPASGRGRSLKRSRRKKRAASSSVFLFGGGRDASNAFVAAAKAPIGRASEEACHAQRHQSLAGRIGARLGRFGRRRSALGSR